MKFNQSYSDNPAYFKGLISQINEGIDFKSYLSAKGYKAIKKSASSMEFSNETDRIVLNLSRSPHTYFNRNDSMDKGLIFRFISRRSDNFYKAIEEGMAVLGNPILDIEPEVKPKEKAPSTTTLEERYNIEKLKKAEYLTSHRGIAKATLEGPTFKGRIFNALHKSASGSKIHNIAFARYDTKGNIKNYMLTNAPYRDKTTGEIKKFKLFLNQNYQYLFTSNPNRKHKKIVITESAIDALSHAEIFGGDNFYIATSGELDSKKLDQVISWIEKVDPQNTLPIALAFDNDQQGHRYDILLLMLQINKKYGRETMLLQYKKPTIEINLNEQLGKEKLDNIEASLNNSNIDQRHFAIIRYADRLTIKIDLAKHQTKGFQRDYKRLFLEFAMRGLADRLSLEKAIGYKDWNERLIALKGLSTLIALNDVNQNLQEKEVYVKLFKGILPKDADTAKVVLKQEDKLHVLTKEQKTIVVPTNKARKFIAYPKEKHAISTANNGPKISLL